MKKINLIIILALVVFACKNETKQDANLEENREKSYDQNDGLVTMKGEFVFDSKQNAAVLQTPNEIYGVIVDDNMHMLNKKVKPFKEDTYTSVPVTVRVKRIENSNDANLWKYNLEIKEILNIEKPNLSKDNIIKLN